jgi:hypothetical protein
MDESELEKIRANIRWVWACDDIELTDDQVEVCLQARLRSQDELAQGRAQELRSRWPKAQARSEKEGRPLEEVLDEEGRARHKAYWDARAAHPPMPPHGET